MRLTKKTARARFWRDHLRSQFKTKMGEIRRKEKKNAQVLSHYYI